MTVMIHMRNSARTGTMVLLFGLGAFFASGQNTLTLEQCYELGKSNYPKIKEQDLIGRSNEYNLENINKRYLPKVLLNGQATYQSDVTSLPISLPGISIDPLSKDQYKLYGEVNQPITDLFVINKLKEASSITSDVDLQKLEIELYSVRERINQLYFGVLLVDAQMEQTAIFRKELNTMLESMQVAQENGVTITSKLNQVRIELLKLDQRDAEMKSSRTALLSVLGLFINQELSETVELELPGAITTQEEINRPELALFELQDNALDLQKELIDAQNIPHLNFFFQGGYGRPALNFLSNNFDPYYITGLRLSWNLSGYYTSKKDKELIAIQQDRVAVQKETFEFGINTAIAQEKSEMSKIEAVIETDAELIALQEEVVETQKIQLDNEEITLTEYLSGLNTLDQLKHNEVLHEIQLIMAKSKLNLTTGN